jgi:hypothetical protein
MIAVTDEPVTAQRFHCAIDVDGAETKRVSDLRLCNREPLMCQFFSRRGPRS